jgi:hypothetical protein
LNDSPPHGVTYIQQKLLSDGSLVVSIDETLIEAAKPWLPTLPTIRADAHPSGPSLRLDQGFVSTAMRDTTPTVYLGNVLAWGDHNLDRFAIASRRSGCGGHIDLEARIATLVAPAKRAENDVPSMLALSAALLLLRGGASPVHAGGVVNPRNGKAWLLVGDARSGKSTTTANLVVAGWRYLSDDYVLLRRGASREIVVEGWPGDFHLDEGWGSHRPTGVRHNVDETQFAEESRQLVAPLGGLLFPEVQRAGETAVQDIACADALARLIRQSPWLLADPGSARDTLDLLTDACAGRNAEIHLGLDTFGNPPLLEERLSQFTG